jgi:hypothetical protein
VCGRYSIYEPMDHDLKTLAPEQLIINRSDLRPIGRYNVEPTTRDHQATQKGLSADYRRPVVLSSERARYGFIQCRIDALCHVFAGALNTHRQPTCPRLSGMWGSRVMGCTNQKTKVNQRVVDVFGLSLPMLGRRLSSEGFRGKPNSNHHNRNHLADRHLAGT